jgi:hypothetical protein
MGRKISSSRSTRGATLVELAISTVVLAFASMAIFSALLSTLQCSHKLNNKCGTIDSFRNTVDKVCRNVRMGRSLGDVFGSTSGGMVQGSSTFPSNRNPVYGAGQAPPNRWPVWADGLAPTTFTAGNQTLIVQVPIFDPSGFPTAIPANTGNPASTTVQDNVETHIYRVVADAQNPGEWILQWARIPGMAAAGYNPAYAQTEPQTICKGIIGPLRDGNPRIFQYIDKTDPSGTPQDSIPNGGQTIAAFSGVILNLELINHDDSGRMEGVWKQPAVIAFKTEVFLRNNSLATTVGMPSTAITP